MYASEPRRTSNAPHGGVFATTHWSVVVAAGDSAAPGAREALERLCRAYWYPLSAFVRRRGYSAHDAQDLTQGYFTCLLEKKYLSRADPAKGRFRSFLLTGLKNFLANEWDHAQAEKRGGKNVFTSLDDAEGEERYRHEPATTTSPETLFERRWALALLEQALDKLHLEYEAAGKSAQFEQLKGFLSGETSDGEDAAPAANLGMRVETVAVAVHRLRQRYREFVRAEIAHTVTSASDAKAEMHHLFAALSC